ncbi:MAG: type I DNA topoisomerase [Acidobacteriota bacterium]
MTKHLIIVESPAKTKTLKKFLGRNYAVEASVGHIRDLAKKDLGIGPDYEPNYVTLPAKKDVVKKLRDAAAKADIVYLAPDPDREGEAIAWHISEILKKPPEAIRRVTFNEITKQAVLKALENPGQIDLRKVDAQQTRRILDRLMGFRLSPLLWDKVKQGLSAGRVQSVALKMVCERQDEIEAFNPEEYWVFGARLLGKQPPPFLARLHQISGKKARVENGAQAAEIETALKAGKFSVSTIERKESKQKPAAPFITSRLQQEAARRFGFSVKRTMGIAQGLYEGKDIGDRGPTGLITYMRTDSTRVAQEAIDGGREYIAATYGKESLPETPNVYKSKKGAQDAHEAIRPTYFDLPPDAVAQYLEPEDLKLYRLIWERFIASQMLPAVFDVTQVDVENGIYTLRATGRVLKSAGFLAIYQETAEETVASADDESPATDLLPALTEGEPLELIDLAKEQKFTQPPAQFSEATLVKALEENGIGRPSTYATILSTLSEREYAERVQGRFNPSALGRLVNKLLQQGFSDIINESYTAGLEGKLDEIEDGQVAWKVAIAEFDVKFSQDLAAAAESLPNVKREGIATDEVCPKCAKPLRLRFGRYGSFLGCSDYPECSYTRNPEETAEQAAAASEAEALIPPCEKCGKPMALKRSRFGTFFGCTGYPDCKNIRKIGKPAEAKSTGVPCPECGQGVIEEKQSRRGKIFFSCNRYPDCKFALWDRPIAKPCPNCNAPFLVEKTTKKLGTRRLCQKEGCGYVEQVEEAS